MMQDGRALQMGTSHYLGQTFAKASNISFQNEKGETEFVHTTSWGVSTRLIGGLIMTHSDDVGLRLPPQIAPKQIVILPILREGTEEKVLAYATDLEAKLKKLAYANEPVRVNFDKRNRPAPDKKWEWIKKGVPIIIEVGPRDVEEGKVAVRLRTDGDAKPQFIALDEFIAKVPELLDKVHNILLSEAKSYCDRFVQKDIKDFAAFKAYFGDKNEFLGDSKKPVGFVRAPWSGDIETTTPLLKELQVTIRCLPLDQGKNLGPCVITGKPAVTEAIFARAY
jgi:prolyl-tRNA synthetase